MRIKFNIILPMVTLLLAVTSCDNQLDIVPKGQTTLEKTADLELLLNQMYDLGGFAYDDICQISGEGLGMSLSVPETFSTTNTLNHAYMFYNESVDRVTLAQTDTKYSAIYKYINYYNTLLAKIDDAKGEEERKPALKAEARVLRAYMHWLLVNMYAKQYDTSSEYDFGGIPYVTDIDNTKVKEKLSLERVYTLILEDCDDEVIETLPEDSRDVCRASRAFGYAVRGKVLMQMKRYDEALPYLRKAYEMNGNVDDRAYIKETQQWTIERQSDTNLIYMSGGPRVFPTMLVISKETEAKFEKGDYVMKYCGDQGWSEMYGTMYSGLEGYKMCMSWNVQGNPWGMTSVRNMLSLAECLVRTGSIREGLELVDKVRKAHVEKPTPYVTLYDMTKMGEKAAMKLLQQTKWIECLGGYENFFDMKRWNTEDDYRTTVSKNLGEYGTVTLEPDSKLWVLPFPANATRYNPTLTQNF